MNKDDHDSTSPNDNSPDDAYFDEYGEDEEGIVEPIILLATWRAHQQHPIPCDNEGASYDDLMHLHYRAFEAILSALAPKVVADLEDAIWELHHRAYLRLQEYLELDPTSLAMNALPADLIYAVATAPYITMPSGTHTLCLDTLALKQKWYRRTRMCIRDN